MGFWPRVVNALSNHRAVIIFPLPWHEAFWMEDVGPGGNSSFPQLYLDSGILLPEVAPLGISGHNGITRSHSSLDACSISLLAQSFVSIHSVFHLGVFCNGSQCVYLVSQLIENEVMLIILA